MQNTLQSIFEITVIFATFFFGITVIFATFSGITVIFATF